MANLSFLIPRLMVGVLAVVFGLSFTWIYKYVGDVTPLFGFSYICLAGWVWGLRGGLAVALLNVPFIALLYNMAGESLPSGFVGPVAAFALGGLVGRLSDVRKKLAQQLDYGRRVEKELRRYQDTLLLKVEERTAEFGQANEALRQEVAERIKIEEELNRSRDRFAKIFKRSPLCMTLCALDDGVYLDVNDSFSDITGYTREQALGKTCIDLGLWTQPGQWAKAVEIIRENGTLQNFEMTFRHQSGEVRQALCSAEIVQLDERPYIILATRDVTDSRRTAGEKARLEMQLRQAQKMDAVGILAGGIAHDFNNILATIVGYGELAQGAAKRGQDNAAHLDHIVTAAERARDLVKQLLTFSRRSETELELIDINRLVAHAIHMLEPTIPKMIDIRMKPAENLDPIKADTVQMEQIVMNLANNARDSMPDGGSLVFETSSVLVDRDFIEQYMEVKPGRYVLLTVTDTGTGMDQQTLEQIFDPFFTTKEIGKGTGLGLSTVYGIVKEHGGHISCHSEPDLGTTFKIHLPAVIPEVEYVEAEESSQQTTPGGQEGILLVDDEEAIREIGTVMLTEAGYRVISAASGEEALESYMNDRDEVALVILDLGMPGMGGHKCLKELLSLNPKLKVLIVSGYSADGKVKDTLQKGAAGYIAKPFKRNGLLRSVRDLLDA